MKIINVQNINIPSLNNKFVGKSFRLTPEYRNFKKELFYCVRKVSIESPYKVAIYVSTYKDIDNIIKPVLDTLEKKGVIDNDRNVEELHVYKIPRKRGKPEDLQVEVNTL